jgi:hypothetical protein
MLKSVVQYRSPEEILAIFCKLLNTVYAYCSVKLTSIILIHFFLLSELQLLAVCPYGQKPAKLAQPDQLATD